MKILTKLCVLIAFAAFGTAAFAALNGPTGLAVDAKGNLYVANFNSNEVQVYNLQHALVKSKTVTTDVSGPMAVALDPLGNLWVANFSSSSITGYTPKKRELTPITTGISNPTAMSIDGSANFWIVNGANGLAICDTNGYLIRSADAGIIPNGATTLYSLSAYDGAVAFGNDTELFQMWETIYLATSGAGGILTPGRNGVAVAYDATGNLWVAEADGAVYIYGSLNLINLGYRPRGMVVDTAHKLVYFSNNAGNSVDVYSTAGQFVTTIH